MRFRLVEPAHLEREWPAIAEQLAPAVLHCPRYDLEALRRHVMAGNGIVLEAMSPASGVIAITAEDERIAWVEAVAGSAGGPKALRTAMRAIEAAVRNAGFKVLRFGGRSGWARLFPEYTPVPDRPEWMERTLVNG